MAHKVSCDSTSDSSSVKKSAASVVSPLSSQQGRGLSRFLCWLFFFFVLGWWMVKTTSRSSPMLRAPFVSLLQESIPKWTSVSSSSSSTTTTHHDDEKGVSFSRNITSFFPPPNNVEDNVGGSFFHIQFDPNHCLESDVFGDNSCHYDWKERVQAKYSIFMNETLDENAYIQGTFEIGDKVPWSFECALCGQPCVFQIPVIHLHHSFDLPPCPIEPKVRSHTMKYHLWRMSPTHGWIDIPLVGHIDIFRGREEPLQPGAPSTTTTTDSMLLVSLDIDVSIK